MSRVFAALLVWMSEGWFAGGRGHLARTPGALVMTYLPASIAKEYETASLKELGRRYGAAPKIIRRHLIELGVKIRPMGRNHTPRIAKIHLDREEVTQLYLIQKQSSQQIGDRFNCSANTVLDKLKKWGVEIRCPGGSRPKDQRYSSTDPINSRWRPKAILRRSKRIEAYAGRTYSDHPRGLIREARWGCSCEVCL